MKTKNPDWQIIPSDPMPGHMYSGTTTTVQRRGTLSGYDIAEKMVNRKSTLSDNPAQWTENIRHARSVSEQIRALHNPAYDVPRTFISHNRVREKWVDGMPLRDLYDTPYIHEHRDEITRALGEFINDMSELYPAYTATGTPQVPPLWFKDNAVLIDTLNDVSHLIPDSDRQLVVDTYNYIINLPENRQMVFAHCDLHPSNILVNTRTHRISFIDFERASFAPQFQVMYSFAALASSALWEYINHLPRKTNPNLTWNYNDNIRALFKLFEDITWELINFSPDTPFDDDCKTFVSKITGFCTQIRMYLAKIHLDEKIRTRPDFQIVPMRHYTQSH